MLLLLLLPLCQCFDHVSQRRQPISAQYCSTQLLILQLQLSPSPLNLHRLNPILITQTPSPTLTSCHKQPLTKRQGTKEGEAKSPSESTTGPFLSFPFHHPYHGTLMSPKLMRVIDHLAPTIGHHRGASSSQAQAANYILNSRVLLFSTPIEL